MTSLISDYFENLPKTIIDAKLANDVGDWHNCKCAPELVKWIVLEVFSLHELNGHNCGGGRPTDAKGALDAVRVRNIKYVVMIIYRQGENERLNERLNRDMWQQCKNRINRGICITNLKIITGLNWVLIGKYCLYHVDKKRLIALSQNNCLYILTIST